MVIDPHERIVVLDGTPTSGRILVQGDLPVGVVDRVMMICADQRQVRQARRPVLRDRGDVVDVAQVGGLGAGGEPAAAVTGGHRGAQCR